jgi:hypothetical protein
LPPVALMPQGRQNYLNNPKGHGRREGPFAAILASF